MVERSQQAVLCCAALWCGVLHGMAQRQAALPPTAALTSHPSGVPSPHRRARDLLFAGDRCRGLAAQHGTAVMSSHAAVMFSLA